MRQVPFQLNAPLLIGTIVSWFVGSRSKDEAVNNARKERGTLLASGFIAGGALMGVVCAALAFCDIKFAAPENETLTNTLGIVVYLALILFLAIYSLRANKESK